MDNSGPACAIVFAVVMFVAGLWIGNDAIELSIKTSCEKLGAFIIDKHAYACKDYP